MRQNAMLQSQHCSVRALEPLTSELTHIRSDFSPLLQPESGTAAEQQPSIRSTGADSEPALAWEAYGHLCGRVAVVALIRRLRPERRLRAPGGLGGGLGRGLG
jgi:hypothetical protein